MPERKSPKSSRSAKPSRPASRSTSRSTSSRAKPARPASRTSRARVEPDAPVYDDAYDDEEETPRSARPVAVGGSSYSDDATDADDVGDDGAPEEDGDGARALADAGTPGTADAPPTPTTEFSSAIERPRDELLAGLASLLIAGSVFLPWYHGVFKSISGWSSGTWGPVVFFLGLAGAAIVLLRRMGVALAFPLEHSLILEGIGWVTVLAILLKRFFPPKLQFGSAGQSWMIFVTMALGVGLAFAGGRSSATAPFVIKPGWFSAKGGKLGIGIVGGALAIGLLFGFVLTGSSTGSPATGPTTSQPKQVNGLPKCATAAKFPVVAGATAFRGYEPVASNSYCVAIFSSKLSPKTLLARENAALRAAKWTTKIVKSIQATGTDSITLTGPKCGSVIFSKNQSQATSMTVYFGSCAKKLTP